MPPQESPALGAIAAELRRIADALERLVGPRVVPLVEVPASGAPPTGPGTGAAADPQADRLERLNSLTGREREILERLMAGRSRTEIAREFFISVRTVDNHKMNLFKKLQVNSTTQAIALAWAARRAGEPAPAPTPPVSPVATPANPHAAPRSQANLLARLTPREQEILDELVRGATRAQIAARLGISPNTVRSHVANLFDKLGVHSAVQAASLLWCRPEERP